MFLGQVIYLLIYLWLKRPQLSEIAKKRDYHVIRNNP